MQPFLTALIIYWGQTLYSCLKLRESELKRMISESVEDAWREIKSIGDDDTEDDWKPYDEYEEITPSHVTHKPHKMYKFTESRINKIVKESIRRMLNEK